MQGGEAAIWPFATPKQLAAARRGDFHNSVQTE